MNLNYDTNTFWGGDTSTFKGFVVNLCAIMTLTPIVAVSQNDVAPARMGWLLDLTGQAFSPLSGLDSFGMLWSQQVCRALPLKRDRCLPPHKEECDLPRMQCKNTACNTFQLRRVECWPLSSRTTLSLPTALLILYTLTPIPLRRFSTSELRQFYCSPTNTMASRVLFTTYAFRGGTTICVPFQTSLSAPEVNIENEDVSDMTDLSILNTLFNYSSQNILALHFIEHILNIKTRELLINEMRRNGQILNRNNKTPTNGIGNVEYWKIEGYGTRVHGKRNTNTARRCNDLTELSKNSNETLPTIDYRGGL